MTKENRLEGIHAHNPLAFYEEVVKCLLLAPCAISQKKATVAGSYLQQAENHKHPLKT